MRAVFMLVAIFSLMALPARADPALEARVLRLEAQLVLTALPLAVAHVREALNAP